MHKPAAPRRLWLSGALTLALFGAMVFQSRQLEPSIPALQFCFDAASFNAILARWGEAGIALFKAHLAIDFLLLGSYGSFGYLLVRHSTLFHPRNQGWRALSTWLTPAAAILDGIENLIHFQLISGPGPHAPSLYLMAGTIASGKWLLIASFVAAVLYLALTPRPVSRGPSAANGRPRSTGKNGQN